MSMKKQFFPVNKYILVAVYALAFVGVVNAEPPFDVGLERIGTIRDAGDDIRTILAQINNHKKKVNSFWVQG